MDGLNATQQAAVDQLMTLTAGSDPQAAVAVLESVEWDVQVCHYDKTWHDESSRYI
jgi:hypothetical protein